MGQLGRLLLQLHHGGHVGVLNGSRLGGQRQAFQQAAQFTAFVENVVACFTHLHVLAQHVHQLLPDHDDEFAVSYEDLRSFLFAQAVAENPDGLLEGTKVEIATVRQSQLLDGVLFLEDVWFSWGYGRIL